MKPFEEAVVPPEEIERVVQESLKNWESDHSMFKLYFPASTSDQAENDMREFFSKEASHKVYKNDVYQVQVRDVKCLMSSWPPMKWLSIKRIDKSPIHDWRELQEIKNMLLGPECEAVELYPKESRCVDTSNQYHLWALSDPKEMFPFGMFGARCVTDEPFAGSVQRPLTKGPDENI